MERPRLKIVFVTQDEPFYIPVYFEKIISQVDKDIAEIARIYALPANLPGKNFFQTIKYYFSYFGPLVFGYLVLLRMFYYASDFISKITGIKNQAHSLGLVCRRHNIPFIKVKRINAKSVGEELKGIAPDILFSVAGGRVFQRDLLSIPNKGCINIHSSLLPKYRGINAGFWVLTKQETVTGVSVHYMNEDLDDGSIILQEEIKIEEDWSLNDLYLKLIEIGSSMIAKTMRLIYEDRVTTQPNDKTQGSYFSFPRPADVEEFRQKGKRFFRYH